MSYKISYGDTPKTTTQKRKFHLHLPVVAIVLVALVLAARTLYPTQTKQITEALFPLTSASSRDALDTFSRHIEAGESFSDAVTAFCLEIINEADSN